jgi:hypothetical protein
MARTSSAEQQEKICPLCGCRLGRDLARKGHVRHCKRPDEAVVLRILGDAGVVERDKKFLKRTRRCPWERGQADRPAG